MTRPGGPRRRKAAGDVPEPAPARVVHALPGRTRLRVRARRGDAAWFEHAAKTLESAPDVDAIVATPFTGSLLVHHRSSTEALLDWAAKAGLLLLEAEEGGPDEAEARLQERLARIDPRLARLAEGPWDLRNAAMVALTALGTLQVARGQVLPAGATLLNEALKLFSAMPARPGRSGTGPAAEDTGSDESGNGGD